MLLIRQAAVYAPEYLGVRDVLVCGGVIEAVEEQIRRAEDALAKIAE